MPMLTIDIPNEGTMTNDCVCISLGVTAFHRAIRRRTDHAHPRESENETRRKNVRLILSVH